MSSISLLIDTDPGVDDALAVMMAAADPACELVALMTVGGNVGLEAVTCNALRLKDLLGLDAPVYPGCRRPLVLPGTDAAHVHGKDGFGDCDLPLPGCRAETEPAAQVLVRMAQASAGKHTLLALGPLTNIAVALHLEPRLPRWIRRFVVMGGAVTGHGNTATPSAEFNFHADPEAARFVLDHWPGVELVDWELVGRNGLPMSTLLHWLEADHPRARFFRRISATVRGWLARRGVDEFLAADALAMAVTLQPELVCARAEHSVRVELQGEATRGQSVVDWRGVCPQWPVHRLVMEVDRAGFHQRLKQALTG